MGVGRNESNHRSRNLFVDRGCSFRVRPTRSTRRIVQRPRRYRHRLRSHFDEACVSAVSARRWPLSHDRRRHVGVDSMPYGTGGGLEGAIRGVDPWHASSRSLDARLSVPVPGSSSRPVQRARATSATARILQATHQLQSRRPATSRDLRSRTRLANHWITRTRVVLPQREECTAYTTDTSD